MPELARYEEAESHLRKVIGSNERLGGGSHRRIGIREPRVFAALREAIYLPPLEHLAEAETGFVRRGRCSSGQVWLDHARALANAALFDDATLLRAGSNAPSSRAKESRW